MTSQPQSQIIPEKKSNPVFLARKTLGLSQEELAGLLELTKNYIWMLEAGRKPISPDLLRKVDQLVERYNSQAPPEPLLVCEDKPSDADYNAPGILRMADQFERYVIHQFSTIRRELTSISTRLDEIERARPSKKKKTGGPP